MLVTRTTKGQVQTYEYRQKENANDKKINIRLNSELLSKAKATAEYLGYKNYSQFIRDLIETEVDKCDFAETTNLENNQKVFKVIGKEKE